MERCGGGCGPWNDDTAAPRPTGPGTAGRRQAVELNNRTSLPADLRELDRRQLNECLRRELEQRPIDEPRVMQLLQALEELEIPQEEDDEQIRAACEKYRAGCIKKAARKRRGIFLRTLLRMGTIAAVVIVLVLGMPRANGENLLVQFATRISRSVVAFFSSEDGDNQVAKGFQTDHPGLREVYDTLRELGVSAPVVPSWLPDGYELTEVKTETFPAKTRIMANFQAEEKTIVLYYDLYGSAVTHEYHKDGTLVDHYEWGDIIHDIYANREKTLVFWERENLQCAIIADCAEDSVTEILKSIYMMEDA